MKHSFLHTLSAAVAALFVVVLLGNNLTWPGGLRSEHEVVRAAAGSFKSGASFALGSVPLSSARSVAQSSAVSPQGNPPPAASYNSTLPLVAPRAIQQTPAPWNSWYNRPTVLRDVTYCTAGNVALRMDVYSPRTARGRTIPAVVYVHGGSWISGDKSQAANWANMLARRGYMVASVNYRLAPQYKWPAQIQDAKCAVRYLRSHAGSYGIDPNRIGAMGDSAGGQLVSMLGLAGESAGFDNSGGYLHESSSVQAVVDLYGPADFTSPERMANLTQLHSVFGLEPGQGYDVLQHASPVTYAHPGAPPFFIVQGNKDTVVYPAQSQELYDRLAAVGAPVSLLIVKNSGHAFLPADGPLQPSLSEIGLRIAAFFDATLGESPYK